MTIPLPPWPDPTTAEGIRFFSAAETLFGLWRAAGFGTQFAIGFVANAEAETSFDPCAKGDYVDEKGQKLPWSAHPVGTATSFGLHQWKASRLEAIRAANPDLDLFRAVMMGTATLEQSVAAAIWELNGPFKRARAVMAAQATAEGAAEQCCALFEQAGATAAGDRRAKMASRWTKYFAQKGF
jgi:hypothetical protein